MIASNSSNALEPIKFNSFRKHAHGFSVRSARGIKGVTEEEIWTVLGAVQALWLTGKGRLPGFADISERARIADWKIDVILADPEFRTRCQLRGISWPKKWDRLKHDSAVIRSRLTPDQVMALQIVTDPTNNRTLQQKLKQAGITYATWRNWMREPNFADAVKTTAEEMLQDMIAPTHTTIARKASSGDIAAANLLYQLTGRHDPNKQQMLEFTKVIGLLLEVISRHVTDPAVLGRVTQDFDVVLSGGQLKEVDTIPANYEPDSDFFEFKEE